MSDLKIVTHKVAADCAVPRYWFEVVGPLDSCGHRHEQRVEAGECKRRLIAQGDAK